MEAQVNSHRDFHVGVQSRDILSLDEWDVLGTSGERGLVGSDIAQAEVDSRSQLSQETRVVGADNAH